MKRIIWGVLIALFASTFGAFAQTDAELDDAKKTPEQRAEKRTENITAKLGLSPEQKTQAKAINLSYIQKRQEINRTYKGKPEERKLQISQLQTSHLAELEAILTPEQKTKFAEWKANKEAKQQNKPARKGRK